MRKRDLIILLLALAAAVTVSISVFAASAIETGSWGLSFRQEGLPPIGNAGRDQLARLGAAYIGNTEEKVLYLTFDAGYENGCTAQILDVNIRRLRIKIEDDTANPTYITTVWGLGYKWGA